MEQKAKWIFIGETTEFFTKSKFYPEIDRESTEWGGIPEDVFISIINGEFEVEHPIDENYKFFIDNEGEPHLMDKEYWQMNFYRL